MEKQQSLTCVNIHPRPPIFTHALPSTHCVGGIPVVIGENDRVKSKDNIETNNLTYSHLNVWEMHGNRSGPETMHWGNVAGRAGCTLIIEGLVVEIPAPAVHVKCPWARH